MLKIFVYLNLCMKNTWVLSYPLSAQQRLWSDLADAQADLSLSWVYTHYVGHVMCHIGLDKQNFWA